MSSYNGEKYIETQIDSILAQQCSMPFDLWVRDDGSSDTTRKILQRYADAGNLMWYTGENLRSAKSFLDLIRHCPNYDFYAFADQDDYWLPEKLDKGLTALMDMQEPGLYFANARLVDKELKDLGRDVYKVNPYRDYYTLLCAGGLLGCTMVFNKSLAQLLIQAPTPDRLIMHDFYVAAVCDLFDGKICYDPGAYMLYRQHGNNVVGVTHSKMGALRDRIHAITSRNTVSVAHQAQSMLLCYPEIPDVKKKRWLERIAGYQQSFSSALSLALSSKTHYCNLNKSLTLRLSLLMRNR